MLSGILPIKIHRGAEIMVIDGCLGIEGDGHFIAFKCLVHRAHVTVVVSQIVPGRGVLGIQLGRTNQMWTSLHFISPIGEEAGKSQAHSHVSGILLHKCLVGLLDRLKALFNAGRQGNGGTILLLQRLLSCLTNPCIDFIHGILIHDKQCFILLFHWIHFF